MTSKATESNRWPRRLSVPFRHVAVVVLFCLGMGLSVAAFSFAREGERQRLSDGFDAAARDRVAAVREQLDAHFLILESLRSFYAASVEVSRQQFHTFSAPLLARHPDIQALEWIPRVSDRQRSDFEAAARGDGLEAFQITERVSQGQMVAASHRQEYFPVYFVEPRKGNETAIGFDLASEAMRLEALGRSRDTGQAVASAPITLVQEIGSQAGFMVFLPVYENGETVETVQQRGDHLRGFILGVFRAGELVEEALANLVPAGIDMDLCDRTEPSEAHSLHYHVSRSRNRGAGGPKYATAGGAGGLTYREIIDLPGRQWSVACAATPTFQDAHTTLYPWGVLAAALVFTLLVSAYLVSAIRNAARQHHLVCELSSSNQAFSKEVSERKQAEKSLRKSEEHFRNLVESVTNYIYTVSVENGRAVKTVHGPGCVSVTGRTDEEYHASPDIWFKMVPQEDRQAVLAQAERLTSGQQCPPLEHRIIRKDGAIRWVRNTPVAVRDEYGGFMGYEGLIQDITDYKKMQEQLLQAQKMEAVGQLAGGIAHDFRNQLTVIKGFAEMLLRRAMVSEAGREHVGEILKAVDRSANLSNELLAFSRKQVLRPEVVKIDDLISGMGKSLARMIGEDICLSLAPGAGDSRVKVDPGQLQQAIVNLVLNARDAMPRGGQLTIETACVNLDQAYTCSHIDASPGSHVMMAVSDTGVGMDRETLARVFDPFFTTKPVGQGTGLGLPMVHGFVRQSGGTIAIYSEPGKGTTVKIYLSLSAAPQNEAQPQRAMPALLRGAETILVVEDEAAIRKMMMETLVEHGYVVHDVPDAQQALARLSGDNCIDLLVTDVVMPGMDGAELARRVRAVNPRGKVLYMSGYTGRALIRHGIDGDDIPLLVKPFGSQALLEAVRNAIGGKEVPPDQAQAAEKAVL